MGDRLDWGNYYPSLVPNESKFKKGFGWLEAEAAPVTGRYASRPGAALSTGPESLRQAIRDFSDGQAAAAVPRVKGDRFMDSLFSGGLMHATGPGMPRGEFDRIGVYTHSTDLGDMHVTSKKTNNYSMRQIGLAHADYADEWVDSFEITRRIGRGLPLFQDKCGTKREYWNGTLGVNKILTIGAVNKILLDDAKDAKQRTIKTPQQVKERFAYIGVLDNVYNNSDLINEVTLLAHFICSGDAMVSPIYNNNSLFAVPGSKCSGLIQYTVEGREKELDELRDTRNLIEVTKAIKKYLKEGLIGYFRIIPWISMDYPARWLIDTWLMHSGEYYKFGIARQTVPPRDSDKMAMWDDVETVCFKDGMEDKWVARKNLEQDMRLMTMIVTCAAN